MAEAPPSAFAPFRYRVFAVLWTATLVSNVGGWMRDTASAWAMTEVSTSPTLVAAVQAAAMLPIFLLSLPAGALADILDRRRLMIWVQAGLAVVSLVFAILALSGNLDAPALLLLTLAAGTGAALAGPVWQTVVPELVPRADLKSAVALNSLGINLARAIGPALGGALVVGAGVGAAYLVDLLSYIFVIAALLWWPRENARPAQPEHLAEAVRAGARYAFASAPLRRVLVRAAIFFAPASCYWALLPLVARDRIGGGAASYGLLLAAVGAGAVAGALLMPRLRRQLAGERLAVMATLLTGTATAALGFAESLGAGMALLAFAGAAWIAMLTSLNATAQGVLPDWVRGRGLAVYLTVFFGTMTAGSLVWGQVASMAGLQAALIVAGSVSIAGAILALLLPLPAADADLSPSHHWPAPIVSDDGMSDRGPVMILIEYRVAPDDQAAFAQAAAALGAIRRRDGAFEWGILADATDSERLTEWFRVGSWAEHLRQHDRVTVADRSVQERVHAYHIGESPPEVRHLLPAGRGATVGIHNHHDGEVEGGRP